MEQLNAVGVFLFAFHNIVFVKIMTKNDILFTFFVISLAEIAVRMYENVNIFSFSAILFTNRMI